MSTHAIIRICNENEEEAAVVLWADGYPEFVRGRFLPELASLSPDWDIEDAEDLTLQMPFALATVLGEDILENPTCVDRYIDFFATYEDARNRTAGVSHEYTVHIVNGKMYY